MIAKATAAKKVVCIELKTQAKEVVLTVNVNENKHCNRQGQANIYKPLQSEKTA